MPDANHQQMWLIALPVAQPPPIRLAPLHPNTMGDTANVRFCQNPWWGRVIGGGSADVTKSVIFTDDNQLGYGGLHCLWHCHPQSTLCRFIPTLWGKPPRLGFVGLSGGGE